jgi:exo-1,4-beta-D-glucosaminidase
MRSRPSTRIARTACAGLGAALALLPAAARAGAAAGDASPTLALSEGWALQSSEKLSVAGEVLSRPGFSVDGWHRAKVPTTVVAALVADGTFPDPMSGMVMRSLPGANYPISENFSNHPMPEGSPFRASWWYRTEFDTPGAFAGRMAWLRFEGISYRANVWLNGVQIGKKEDVVGTFRKFSFDVTAALKPGARNALAVEVFAPEVTDLALTFVDWNPAPPDKNMGLWAGVGLRATGPVTLAPPHVAVDLDTPSLEQARVTVTADVRNAGAGPVEALLKGSIEGREFSRTVHLAAGEQKRVAFQPQRFPALVLDRPRVWWPHGLGAQERYELQLTVSVAGTASDMRRESFGVQRHEGELTAKGHWQYKLNGRPLLIRGGGWTMDMMLRPDLERTEAELRYVKDMNLNTVRPEGKLETDGFYDLTDRLGVLVMPGWCCCDHWEQWPKWSTENRVVAAESLRDQITRIRNHPSVFVWLNSSDGAPAPDIERLYLDVLAERGWDRPTISSATDQVSSVTGPSGVKMLGPYDYVPPNYWLTDTKRGGAYGFNTETSPGPAVPPVESLRAMLGPDHLWPIDEVWNFHAGGHEFKNIERYTQALERRYGKARDVADYAWKSQASAYEAQRAMFEAFRRNRGTATGIVQWMLHNAWPSLIWHLYDWYLRPGGGYFGTKKANEPVHALYSYDDRSVVVVNESFEARPGLKLAVRVLDLGMKERLAREVPVDVPADGQARALVLPELPGLTPTYFLRLRLTDAAGGVVSSNFYWLSTRPDVLDWAKAEWYVTPQSEYADLSALARLPSVNLELSAESDASEGEGRTRVRVANPSRNLAFLVRLKVTKGKGGDELLPVLWEDNYFELLPGERREVAARYRSKDLGGQAPGVEVDGWNVTRAAR